MAGDKYRDTNSVRHTADEAKRSRRRRGAALTLGTLVLAAVLTVVALHLTPLPRPACALMGLGLAGAMVYAVRHNLIRGEGFDYKDI